MAKVITTNAFGQKIVVEDSMLNGNPNEGAAPVPAPVPAPVQPSVAPTITGDVAKPFNQPVPQQTVTQPQPTAPTQPKAKIVAASVPTPPPAPLQPSVITAQVNPGVPTIIPDLTYVPPAVAPNAATVEVTRPNLPSDTATTANYSNAVSTGVNGSLAGINSTIGSLYDQQKTMYQGDLEKANTAYSSAMGQYGAAATGNDISNTQQQLLDTYKVRSNMEEMQSIQLEATKLAYQAQQGIDQINREGFLGSLKSRKAQNLATNANTRISFLNNTANIISKNIDVARNVVNDVVATLKFEKTNEIQYLQAQLSAASADRTNAKAGVVKNLESQIKNAETERDAVQKNADKVFELQLKNPTLTTKAGVTYTDTPEEVSRKIGNFVVQNPEYDPSNKVVTKGGQLVLVNAQGATVKNLGAASAGDVLKSKVDMIKDLASAFPGASFDTIENYVNNGMSAIVGNSIAPSPLASSLKKNNPLLLDEDILKAAGLVKGIDYNVGSKALNKFDSSFVITTPSGRKYDVGNYATSPNSEPNLKKYTEQTANALGATPDALRITSYIKGVNKNSPITGDMVIASANKYGVDPIMMIALMQEDSQLGTVGKGVRTMNPGNVGNTDDGSTNQLGSWQQGVDAVAQNLTSRVPGAKFWNADKPQDAGTPEIISGDPVAATIKAIDSDKFWSSSFSSKMTQVGITKEDWKTFTPSEKEEAIKRSFVNTTSNVPTASVSGFAGSSKGEVQAAKDAAKKKEADGGLTASEIANNIISGKSSLDVKSLPTAMRASVDNELTKKRMELTKNGDVIGFIRASAGSKDVSSTFVDQFQKVLDTQQRVANISQEILNTDTGPISGIISSNNPYNTKAQALKSQLKTLVPGLARGVYSEVGVLTDNDVKLYSNGLASLTNTQDLNRALLAISTKQIANSIESKLKTQAKLGFDVSGFASEYETLRNQANESLASIYGSSNVPGAIKKLKDGTFAQVNPDGKTLTRIE